MSDETKNPYQDTLNLPQTEFSLRANAAIKEPEILAYWQSNNINEKATALNQGNEPFILLDGPPYANGHLHLGHALNNILKDTVVKSKRMAGRYAPFVPGWDCHGLPIELKVTTQLGIEKNSRKTLEERVSLKKACRIYAADWIEVQSKELQDMGMLGDWAGRYSTMDPTYEADILRAFALFTEKGFISRKGRTVPWCFTCQTVLAASEIEYKDRKDPSVYVLFDLDATTYRYTFPFLHEQKPDLAVGFLVWTTTPWTIPLNRAVVLNPEAEYVVLQGKEANRAFMVAKELADKVCATLGIEKKELAEFDAQVFAPRVNAGEKTLMKVNHPLIDGFQVPVLLDEMVMVSDGTACLHSAPGCGPEDYLLGLRHGIEIFSPLSSDGRFTHGIMPVELEGMSVVDGQIWVIKTLAHRGKLMHKASINHSYPHCWRCRNGLMFRATDQWFCDLKKNNLVENALKEIDKIEFIPAWGKTRLQSFIGNRAEWCISRQRVWGVPITALLCMTCDNAFLDAAFIRAVADQVEKVGIEYWDEITLEQLQATGILKKDFSCEHCKNADLSQFRKELDILDVWFDSGVAHYAVAKKDPRLGVPVDLQLEGSDQHRGWFQSTMLCAIALYGHAATRAFLTHGYVVDEDHRKMSKSLGNGVEPQEIIKQYSRDVLRLWVASVDAEGDVVISEKLLKNVAETYRKIRNSCRFMISNLYDFDVKKHAVSFDKLLVVDLYILVKLQELQKKIATYYEAYNFSGVVQELNTFCVNDLSALYLDVSKDRLYVEQPDSQVRRSAQTALYQVLDTITLLMAPILSFLAEEVSGFYLKDKQDSIHLQLFRPKLDVKVSEQFTAGWNLLEQLRDVVLVSLEEKRREGIIRHSLEAQVTLQLDFSEDASVLELFFKNFVTHESLERFLKDWFIVSKVTLVPLYSPAAPSGQTATGSVLPWVQVLASHADGVKCPRCWQWDNETDLCKRCLGIVKK